MVSDRVDAASEDGSRDATERSGLGAQTLQKLQRVTWRSVLQVVLMLVAAWILVSKFAGLDLAALGDQLEDASWSLVVVAFVAAQTPRLAQACSTLGASPQPLVFVPVYVLQL